MTTCNYFTKVTLQPSHASLPVIGSLLIYTPKPDKPCARHLKIELYFLSAHAHNENLKWSTMHHLHKVSYTGQKTMNIYLCMFVHPHPGQNQEYSCTQMSQMCCYKSESNHQCRLRIHQYLHNFNVTVNYTLDKNQQITLLFRLFTQPSYTTHNYTQLQGNWGPT